VRISPHVSQNDAATAYLFVSLITAASSSCSSSRIAYVIRSGTPSGKCRSTRSRKLAHVRQARRRVEVDVGDDHEPLAVNEFRSLERLTNGGAVTFITCR
jgi:hypothetical protein